MFWSSFGLNWPISDEFKLTNCDQNCSCLGCHHPGGYFIYWALLISFTFKVNVQLDITAHTWIELKLCILIIRRRVDSMKTPAFFYGYAHLKINFSIFSGPKITSAKNRKTSRTATCDFWGRGWGSGLRLRPRSGRRSRKSPRRWGRSRKVTLRFFLCYCRKSGSRESFDLTSFLSCLSQPRFRA